MSGEPRGSGPTQEDDRLDARRTWLWTGGALAVTVLLCVTAWLTLGALDDGEPGAAAPDGPPTTRAGSGSRPFGDPARPSDSVPAESADGYGWVDRDAGIARVPVEAAMEILVEWRGPPEETPVPDTTAPPDTAGEPAPATGRHPTMSRVDVEPRTGARLPLEVAFTDADGRRGPLGATFSGELPALVVPGWYRCRMLCGTVLDGLADAVAVLERRHDLRAGRDFRVVALSIDPREGPSDARERRERVRARLGASGTLRGWSFLTGPDGAARRVADSLGFRYAWDDATDQYAHAAAVFAVSPTGTLTGALWGVDFAPDDVEGAVSRAAAERPGPSLEKVLVRCFRYTPALKRHAGLIAGVLKGGGVLIVLGLAGVFVLAGRRAARRAPPEEAS